MTLTIVAQVDPSQLNSNVNPVHFMHDLENDILKLMDKQKFIAASSVEITFDYDQGTEEDSRRLFNIIQQFSMKAKDGQQDTGHKG
jgi:hypothetical protein